MTAMSSSRWKYYASVLQGSILEPSLCLVSSMILLIIISEIMLSMMLLLFTLNVICDLGFVVTSLFYF